MLEDQKVLFVEAERFINAGGRAQDMRLATDDVSSADWTRQLKPRR